MKNSIKITVSFLLAFVLLYDSLGFSLYKTFIAFACILILSTLKFKFKINEGYYVSFVIAAFLALVYSFINDIYKNNISFIISDPDFCFYAKCVLYIVSPVISMWILIWCFKKLSYSSQENLNIPDLYLEREKDLKRLYDAFIKHSLIGVVGDWGSGKTLLTQYLEINVQKNYKNKWAFIRFNLLSCKLDRIEYTIIDEIENILDSYHLVSTHTRRLKNILASNEILKAVCSYIFPSEPYSKAIENLRKQIVNNNIHIAIIVEDIDRVDDSNSIDKLINITNELQAGAGTNIKIIYEYNSAKLAELNPKFNKDFLDKYISCEIFVTPVKIKNLIDRIIKNNQYTQIKVDDFAFLGLPTKIIELNQNFGINFEAHISNLEYPVRKVEHFLESVENYLDELNIKDQILRDKYVRVVIVFFFIKIFDYNFFNRLDNFNNIFDSFYFVEKSGNGDEENTKRIDALLSEYYSIDKKQDKETYIKEKNKFIDRIKNIIFDPLNRSCYMYISWLEYNVFTSSSGEAMYLASKTGLDRIFHNEFVDALFRNMLWSGKNSSSDINLLIENLNNDVFSSPDETKWLTLFDNFVRKNNSHFYQNRLGSEHTMFLFGVDDFITIFQCMSMMSFNNQNWFRLCKLLFLHVDSFNGSDKKPNWEVVNRCLSYVTFQDRNTLMLVLKKYSTISPTVSFVNQEKYWEFIYNVLVNLEMYGGKIVIPLLQDLRAYTNPINPISKTKDDKLAKHMIDEVFNPMKEIITECIDYKSHYSIDQETINELNLYTAFIDTNIKLLNSKNIYEAPDFITVSIKTGKDIHYDTIQDIISRNYSSKEELDSVINQKLNEKKIMPLDVVYILRKLKNKPYSGGNN